MSDPSDPNDVDWGRVFALANQLGPTLVGLDIKLVATAFAVVLGRAEMRRIPAPEPVKLGVYVMNQIVRWAEPAPFSAPPSRSVS